MHTGPHASARSRPTSLHALCGAALAAFATAAALAQAPIVNPGAPGAEPRPLRADEAIALARTAYTSADVQFLRDMIPHHQQAIDMAALAKDRTNRKELLDAAGRIDASQKDEIEFMQGWLEERNEPAARRRQLRITPHTTPRTRRPRITRRTRRAHERHGHARADGRARRGERHGLRPPVPRAHDQAPRGRRGDGRGAHGAAGLGVRAGAVRVHARRHERPERRDRAHERAAGRAVGRPAREPQGRLRRRRRGDPEPRRKSSRCRSRRGSSIPRTRRTCRRSGSRRSRPTAERRPAAAQRDDEDEEPAGGNNRDARSPLLSFANTDLAFRGDLMVVGSYHGFNVYRLQGDQAPQLLSSVVCPGGQGDVSIVGDLLIMSVEQTRGRVDCGLEGVEVDASPERFRGMRIFDIADPARPKQVGQVQTCRGSHTHSVVASDDAPDRRLQLGHGRRARGGGARGLHRQRRRRHAHGALSHRRHRDSGRATRRARASSTAPPCSRIPRPASWPASGAAATTATRRRRPARRTSATTSRCSRRPASPRARARATASCSTSAIR